MRALVLAFAAVLALPAVAGAQPAWAKAYEDGVELVKKGNNDALAEQKLIEARDHSRAPKQSRRASFSGVVRLPFIPDFYLGVIAARNGRHARATQLLESALANDLVTEGDRAEYQLAMASLQRARDDRAREDREKLAANTRPVTPVRPPDKPPDKPPVTVPSTQTPGTPSGQPTTNPVTVVPPVNRPPPPPANVDPGWLNGFRRAMDASRSALGQGRYAEARSSQTAARTAAGDAASRSAADALGREIDGAQIQQSQRIVESVRLAIRRKDAEGAATQVATLETLSPQHVALPGLRREILALTAGLQGAAALARVERVGVRLFLSGNYKQAADELERAVDSRVTSPRVYLFLASSRAAQALLAAKDDRDALVAEARKTYALAKPAGGAIAADQRFISPSILELLNGS